MYKREFLKVAGMAGIAAMAIPGGIFANDRAPFAAQKAPFTLPALPFAYDALEPNIDKMTMEIHHDKHHAGYVNNLNKAVKGTAFEKLSLEEILAKVTDKDAAIRNNAGGHFNHSLFWTILSPKKSDPSPDLKAAINASFGSFDAFKNEFNTAAKTVFGSGWAWLVKNKQGKLEVTKSANQDNTLMAKLVDKTATPIMGLDVWEHAYYLKYQNKRPDYINAFWNVINWDEVGKRFAAAK